MKTLAIIAFIWILTLAIGAGFHLLGQAIWFGIVLSILAGLWHYIENRK